VVTREVLCNYPNLPSQLPRGDSVFSLVCQVPEVPARLADPTYSELVPSDTSRTKLVAWKLDKILLFEIALSYTARNVARKVLLSI
jgi:hypothetical protein